MGWAILLAAIALIAALPLAAEVLRQPVGAAQRRAAGGGFARLSQGVTHYRWHGPEDGRVVVFVHGLTTASYVWQGLTSALAARGFRCLTYDLYGRGLSDRPKGPQTRDFFLRQLRELLADQGVGGRFVLAGYSMGGSIATVFAAEAPERLDALVLVAPAGLVHRPTRFAEVCRRLPGPGDWMMTVFGGLELRAGRVPAASSVPDIADRQAAETRTRGYLRSVLSAQRNLLADRLDADHAAIARAGLPVLALWGGDDGVIPPQARDELARINAAARQVTVEGAGHGLPHTHTPRTADEIAAFLREV